MASSGISRRGAAATLGISHTVLYGWLERGRAHPDIEPYGSFAGDYLQAERGLECAAAGTIAMVVAQLYAMAKEQRWAELFEAGPQLKELLHVLAARFPEDWGHTAHRKPEQEPDGAAYLERTGMTADQLRAMLRDPPEPVLLAMVAEGDAIYQLLLASGWQPNGEVTSGNVRADRTGEEDSGGMPERGGEGA